MGGSLVALYRSGNEIYLQIDRRVRRLDGSVSVVLQRTGSACSMEIISNEPGCQSLKLVYATPSTVVPITEDPTPFSEEEDFDFGLLIANVATDAERRSRIYR
jgi:hypothetical protein